MPVVHNVSRSVFRCLVALLLACSTPSVAADLIEFWDTPRYGGNSFNSEPPDEAYFDALAGTGASWVRLTFSKWQGAGRDFLLADADHYEHLVEADLERLLAVLDAAHAAGLKVVIAPLSLPGNRWQQQNGNTYDDRLWSDKRFWEQSAAFWRDLASALRSHPAIAAYNLLNEPAPERTQSLAENAPLADTREFMSKQTGTARDLPAFYDFVIAAIREVDEFTPIMVDSGFFANPRSLAAWPAALADERVLYAVHMYEPWIATSARNLRRDEPLRYPGVATDYAGQSLRWNAAAVRSHVAAAFKWANEQDLSSTRIVLAEFGCMRLWADCGTYLTDVLDAINGFNGHWAFYAFREDEWDGMDYELPALFPAGRFYWLTEQGQYDKIPRTGSLMELLRERMRN